MSTVTTEGSSMNFRCLIGRHRYFVVRDFSYTMHLVACRRCGRQWGMCDTVQVFVPWDGELEELAQAYVAQRESA